VGSVLCGGRDFIREARRGRKMLGGGMRQAGIIAAAGRYAIAHNIPRLAEDHENAARLAAGLARHAELAVAPVQTNMVFVGVPETIAAAFSAHLAAEGVRPYGAPEGVRPSGTARQRWCTHLDVARADVDAAIASVDRFFAQRR
jgi:threonine aldolase